MPKKNTRSRVGENDERALSLDAPRSSGGTSDDEGVKEDEYKREYRTIPRLSIYDGGNFEDWEMRLKYSLLREGLEDMIEECAIEKKYREEDPQLRKTSKTYKAFRKRNGEAMCFIIERLSPRVLLRVRNTVTAFEMFTNLVILYKSATEVGRDAVRRKFYQLQFNEQEDIREYIEKFESLADQFRTLGGQLSPQEELEQFRTSLPGSFNHIRNWFSLLDRKDQSYQILKKKVMEDCDFNRRDYRVRDCMALRINGGERRSFQSGQLEAERPYVAKVNYRERRPPLKCFGCGGVGHFAREGPSKSRSMGRDYRTTAEYESRVNQNEGQTAERMRDSGEKFKNNSDQRSESRESGSGAVAKEGDSKRDQGEKAIPFSFRADESGGQYSFGKIIERIDKNPVQRALMVATEQRDEYRSDEFIIDSDATEHMVSSTYGLKNRRQPMGNAQIQGAESTSIMRPEFIGDLHLIVKDRFNKFKEIVLLNVSYVRNLTCNIISEDRITQTSAEIRFTSRYAEAYVPGKDGMSMFVADRIDRAKRLRCCILDEHVEFGNVDVDRCFALNSIRLIENVSEYESGDIEWLWHRRMGHISGKYLKMMPQVVDGIPKMNNSVDKFLDCEVCIKAKSSRSPHTQERTRAIRILEILCSDVLGPLVESEREKLKYVVTFIDDMSNYSTVYTIKSRAEVAESFKDYLNKCEAMFSDVRVRLFRCDNAREFVMGDLANICESRGIAIDPSNPYCPEQNARAERYNQILMERTRAMIYDSYIEKEEWPLVVKCAVYLINRSPTRSNSGRLTPYELFHGNRPDLSNIRVFGCVAWQHIDEPIRRGKPGYAKLDPRAIERAFVGYTLNGYLLIEPDSGRIYRLCNVHFVENRNYGELKQRKIKDRDDEYSFGADEFSYEQPDRPSYQLDHNYALAYVVKNGEETALSDNVPKSFRGAMGSTFAEEWKDAIREEIRSLYENEVWELETNVGQRTVPVIWVFAVKHDGRGERARARLVADGSKDRWNYSGEEVYSPVASGVTIRWLFSLVNRLDLDLWQLDVKTAFLYGKLDREVFVRIPEGLNYSNNKYVLRLKRVLYGLRISSRIWFDKLADKIGEMGFQSFVADRCVYFKREGRSICIIIIYVDDMLMASNNGSWANECIILFKNEFKMKVDVDPRCFLGIEIERDRTRKVIRLHQRNYLLSILRRFRMTECIPKETPMETNLTIKPTGIKNEMTELRSMIGALLFLARFTRPDVAYPVNYVSRFQSEATPQIVAYARRIIRYLRGTLNAGLIYRSNGNRAVTAFVDASFASFKEDQFQSTTGYLIYTFGDLIEWGVKKQTRSMTSTVAAEYVALNDTVKCISFVRHLNVQILLVKDSYLVYEDSTSVRCLAYGGDSTEGRFLWTKYFAIKQAVENGEIVIAYVPGMFQPADLLTKPVDVVVLRRLRPFIVDLGAEEEVGNQSSEIS